MADAGEGLRFCGRVLFRALDAPASGASLCSWSMHHRHAAGDAAQSDLRDFCNRPRRVISHGGAISLPTGPRLAATASRRPLEQVGRRRPMKIKDYSGADRPQPHRRCWTVGPDLGERRSFSAGGDGGRKSPEPLAVQSATGRLRRPAIYRGSVSLRQRLPLSL